MLPEHSASDTDGVGSRPIRSRPYNLARYTGELNVKDFSENISQQ
jgi:hypothetical protein